MTRQAETAATTAQQAADRVHQLFNAAWSLAAASAYLSTGRCTDQQARVLAAVGLADPHEGGWRPAPGLTALADRPERLGVTLPHHLHQMAAVAAGGRPQDVAPDAAGETTAVETMADRLLHDVVPRLPGLADRLDTTGAAALAARAGDGRMLAAFCRLVPTLAVTAFEADPGQYERARQALAAAGVADRAELRPGELTDLDEQDRYDLAQLPVMLTSPASMTEAPARIFRALRAGGWLIAMPVSPTGDTLDAAVLHWRVADQGGTVTPPDDLEQHLRAAGFDPVRSLPDMPMPLIVAQRPSP